MSLDSLSIELTSEGMQPTTTIHLHQSALIKTTIGAMMISFSAVWVRLAQVAPTVSAFYRVGFGAVFLLAILAFRRESLWRGWSVLGLSLIAGLFFALDLYAWHRCIGYVGPGLATILGNFEVFLVPVVGLLLYKERLSLRFVLAVPLAIVGLFMIVGVRWDQLSQDYRIGIGWGLATAVFYTGFLVSLRRLQARPSAPSAALSLMIVSIFSAIYLAADIFGNGESFAIPTIQSGLALVALGLFSQTAGWLLITHSLPRIPAAIAGLLLLLQPSLAFVWDVLFFGRQTSSIAWAGVALAIGAIYLGTTGKEASS
jgi:drug/metabolite transporter (DMT)-like permease